MDKHAPVQTRTIVVRPRVPWYRDDIRQTKKEGGKPSVNGDPLS